MKIIKHLSSFALFALFATTANASAIFNYQQMADNSSDANYFGETILEGTSITISGITVTSTGDYLGSGDGWAYLDRGNAGLGVCHTNGGNCAGSSDDNLTDDEVLKLAFSSIISLDSLTLKKGNHGAFGDEGLDGADIFQLSLDGISYTAFDYSDGAFLGLMSDEFYFKTVTPANDDDAIYISSLTVSTVPAPASLLLMGIGLAALGLKRKLN